MIRVALSGEQHGRPAGTVYQYRARTYPHALVALARAEAEYGPPSPTCHMCGGRVTYSHAKWGGICDDCGVSPLKAGDL